MSWMGSLGALRLAGGPGGVVTNARLAWRLLKDARVPLRNKMIVPAVVLYWVWPLDFLMDFLPFLGQVDDLTALVLAVMLFLRVAPGRIVEEHRAALTGRRASRPRPERGDYIEGSYRVLDEEERR